MNRNARIKLKTQLLEERLNHCEDCGSQEKLEFHHILPTKLHGAGRGSQNRLYDIQKHPLNYRLLCHKCHESYHYMMITFYTRIDAI